MGGEEKPNKEEATEPVKPEVTPVPGGFDLAKRNLQPGAIKNALAALPRTSPDRTILVLTEDFPLDATGQEENRKIKGFIHDRLSEFSELGMDTEIHSHTARVVIPGWKKKIIHLTLSAHPPGVSPNFYYSRGMPDGETILLNDKDLRRFENLMPSGSAGESAEVTIKVPASKRARQFSRHAIVFRILGFTTSLRDSAIYVNGGVATLTFRGTLTPPEP